MAHSLTEMTECTTAGPWCKRPKSGEQSVGRGAADRVVPEGNVDWRRPGQRGRYFTLSDS